MPPTIQAANTSAAEPTVRAMSLVTRKTPVPIVSPMTMAVAEHNPRPRTRPGAGGEDALGPVEGMEGVSLLSRWERVKPLSSPQRHRGTELTNLRMTIEGRRLENCFALRWAGMLFNRQLPLFPNADVYFSIPPFSMSS